MKSRKPIIKLLLVALAFYTLSLGTAWAVELTVPLPGTDKDVTDPDPAVYVRNLYTFGIGLAALFAMAQIVFGGVQYTVSAGNPSLQGDAKDRILNAIYGLILLLSAFLILQTINPKLTTLTIEGVTPLPKVGKFEYQSISDIEKLIAKENEAIAKSKKLREAHAEQEKKAQEAEEKYQADLENKQARLERNREAIKARQIQIEKLTEERKYAAINRARMVLEAGRLEDLARQEKQKFISNDEDVRLYEQNAQNIYKENAAITRFINERDAAIKKINLEIIGYQDDITVTEKELEL